jgi:hypothetical protein
MSISGFTSKYLEREKKTVPRCTVILTISNIGNRNSTGKAPKRFLKMVPIKWRVSVQDRIDGVFNDGHNR